MQFITLITFCFAAGMAASAPLKAASEEARPKTEAMEPSSEAKRAEKAAQILTTLTQSGDKEIPQELLDHARGIAVIPHVIKGAVGVGGRFGKGLVSKRMADGHWGPPVYVDVGGLSYGFQIGVQATDLVLVFMEPDGLESLLSDKIQLGVDASVAAGPLGRDAKAGTNLTLDAAIYSYSRSKGVFAGVALEGAVLGIDDSANASVYGAEATAENILNNKAVIVPETVMPFCNALRTNAPPSSKS